MVIHLPPDLFASLRAGQPGAEVQTEIDGRRITFPRVHASCDYKSPLRFEDEVKIHVQVRERRAKSLTYDFTFRKVGSDDLCARGAITCVCVTVDRDSGQMKATEIPPSIAALFEPV